MHIAVFGGTYNPVHYGHLRVAEEAAEALSIDRVVFMPAYAAPHKADEPDVSPAARLEMVRIAVRSNPRFEASDLEIKRGGRSYTVDTVREVLAKTPGLTRLSLMLGADSFNDISMWREHATIVRLASLVVVPRPGHLIKKPDEALGIELAKEFWYDSAVGAYVNEAGITITCLDTTLMPVSSTDVRQRRWQGRSVKYLVPEGVEEFIVKTGLYSRP